MLKKYFGTGFSNTIIQLTGSREVYFPKNITNKNNLPAYHENISWVIRK